MIRAVRTGIDFSPQSAVALNHAVGIARRLGAPLELVHANEVFHDYHAEQGAPHPEEVVSFIESNERAAREELEAIRVECARSGIEASTTIHRTKAVEALCSREPSDSLVVVGATGRSGLDRFLIGSTATRLARSCRDPLLVTRNGRTRYQRVLVGTDFGEPAGRALEIALAIVEPDARVDLLHAWRLPTVFTGYLAAREHEELIGRLAKQVIDGAAAQAKPLVERFASFDIEFDTTQGDPATAIIDRSAGYDLVAVGSHGRKGVRRILAGSVAELVVAHSACTVLIVH